MFVLVQVTAMLSACDAAVCPVGTHEVNAHCVRDESNIPGQAAGPMMAMSASPGQDAATAPALTSRDGSAPAFGQSVDAGMLTGGNENAGGQNGNTAAGTSGGSSGSAGASGAAGADQTPSRSTPQQSAGNGGSSGMTSTAGVTGGATAGVAGVVSSATTGAAGAMPSSTPCVAMDETCDGRDNDCDGRTDENIPLRPCGISRPPCSQGTVSCVNGRWTECVGEIGPTAEQCDGIDNDCNGYIDEICECRVNDVMPCGNQNPPCREGKRRCIDGWWSATCEGEVKGTPEVCDGIDNDCSGEADDVGGLCPFECGGTLGCVVCLTSADCAASYECRNNNCVMVQ
jgi:Putative metal-binding motif